MTATRLQLKIPGPGIPIPANKLTQAKEEILAPLKRDSGYSPAWVTQILQSVMIPNFVLYIK